MPTISDSTNAEMDSRYKSRGFSAAESYTQSGSNLQPSGLLSDSRRNRVNEARAEINSLFEPAPVVPETGSNIKISIEYLLHTGSLLRSYREAATNRPANLNYTTKQKPGLLSRSLRLLTGSENVRIPRIRLQSRPTHRELIQRESELGGHLFGDIAEGQHWQFFNLDPQTWFWHKEWMDEKNKAHSNTIRYEVHENGIMKVQDGAPYYFVEGHELNNFMAATRLYYERVSHDIYRRDPATGQPLAVS